MTSKQTSSNTGLCKSDLIKIKTFLHQITALKAQKEGQATTMKSLFASPVQNKVL